MKETRNKEFDEIRMNCEECKERKVYKQEYDELTSDREVTKFVVFNEAEDEQDQYLGTFVNRPHAFNELIDRHYKYHVAKRN